MTENDYAQLQAMGQMAQPKEHGSFYEFEALKARIDEYVRVRTALQTISSYSEDPMTWQEIISGLEGEANRLQAMHLAGKLT